MQFHSTRVKIGVEQLFFSGILCMYVPIGGAGYGVYGDLVMDNIFQSLTHGPLETIATILITMHLVFAYVIIQNPLSQVFEKPLKVPDSKFLPKTTFRTFLFQKCVNISLVKQIWHFLASSMEL